MENVFWSYLGAEEKNRPLDLGKPQIDPCGSDPASIEAVRFEKA